MPLNSERRRRQRKPSEALKGDMLTVRVSRDEYDTIQAAADLMCKSINRFCADALIDAAIEVLPQEAEQRATAKEWTNDA